MSSRVHVLRRDEYWKFPLLAEKFASKQLFRNSSYYLEQRLLCAADQPRRELSAPNLLLCSNSDANEVSSGSTRLTRDELYAFN